MDPSSSTRMPGRLVPAGGGHVPVRVRGFVEEADRRAPAGSGAGSPSCWRAPTRRGRVVDGYTVLGYLPEGWSQVVDFELWSSEQAGEPAVARAVLEGAHGERDLFVMLSWPRRRA